MYYVCKLHNVHGTQTHLYINIFIHKRTQLSHVMYACTFPVPPLSLPTTPNLNTRATNPAFRFGWFDCKFPSVQLLSRQNFQCLLCHLKVDVCHKGETWGNELLSHSHRYRTTNHNILPVFMLKSSIGRPPISSNCFFSSLSFSNLCNAGI